MKAFSVLPPPVALESLPAVGTSHHSLMMLFVAVVVAVLGALEVMVYWEVCAVAAVVMVPVGVVSWWLVLRVSLTLVVVAVALYVWPVLLRDRSHSL